MSIIIFQIAWKYKLFMQRFSNNLKQVKQKEYVRLLKPIANAADLKEMSKITKLFIIT